ncbi:hypothetical protein NEMIN01_1292 [Nematocida minor]|uniref:uncharacterized protein n=1 Tax=Nematocida minor TaxID=1912983 RepID=UPI00221ECD10|nr:uncharacterized protein NEMIN01_1292 [Nematocida minor]KAI5190959.1 hypothetical protein NEMIN01_1292 [Nematocida minor]
MNASTEQKKTHTEPQSIIKRFLIMIMSMIESVLLKIQSLAKDVLNKKSSKASKASKSKKAGASEASETSKNSDIFRSAAYETFFLLQFFLIAYVSKISMEHATPYIIDAVVSATKMLSSSSHATLSAIGKNEEAVRFWSKIAIILVYVGFRAAVFKKFITRHLQNSKMDKPFSSLFIMLHTIVGLTA